VLGVPHAEGLVLPGGPAREPAVRAPWPDWVSWKPNVTWCYDFTHFTRARRVAVAVIDVLSRRWLATLVSAEETSTQIEVAFTAALAEAGLDTLLDARLLAALRAGEVVVDALDDGQLPVLLAMSDNGPRMPSHTTREFMAACAIMQCFGRPSDPQRPGVDRVAVQPRQGRMATPGEDPRPRRARPRTRPRPARVQHTAPARRHRLRNPDDEHHGRADSIRQARRDGLPQHAPHA
jgi:putative transposase